MSYDVKGLCKIPLEKGSPSFISNNLSSDGTHYVFAKEGGVQILPERENPDAVRRTVDFSGPGLLPMQVRHLDVSGIGHVLAVCTTKGLELWSPDGAQKIFAYELPDKYASAEGSKLFMRGLCSVVIPSADQIWAGSSSGDILIFEVRGGSVAFLKSIKADNHSIADITTDNDGYVLVSDDEGGLSLWDAATAEPLWTGPGDGFPCISVRFMASVFIAAFASGHLRVFDKASQQMVMEVVAHSRWMNAMELHPTKNRVATVSEDMTVNVFAIDDKKLKADLLMTTKVQDRILCGVQFVRKGLAAVAYDSDCIYLWDELQ